jgi:phage/plasmid primase-like uncharacterized protein
MTRFNDASADELAGRLALKRHGHEFRGACPACGYPGTFSLTSKDGCPVWRCHSCQDQKSTTAAVKAAMGNDWQPPSQAKRRKAEGTDTRSARAVAIFDRAHPFPGSPADRYLAGRGLAEITYPVLRYHPAVRHPNVRGTTFPAMLALVTSTATGEPIALHKTFIEPDGTGKADVEPARASNGHPHGGAIMLDTPIPGRPLVIGEGIETSLSAGLLLGVPAWCAISAGNLPFITPPRTVSEVIVAADHDDPGQRAAEKAAKRFAAQGFKVSIRTPTTPGWDFNDVLMAGGGQ